MWDETTLPTEEVKERKIMKLLLKIKNGTPPVRKVALRQITEKAKEFGAGPLFNQILPLLMSPTLEDQERHLLVKVIDRVLYKLDDLVRRMCTRFLSSSSRFSSTRTTTRVRKDVKIVSNLSKAAGLATMIAIMRPDIDNPDEYVRNTTARAFAVSRRRLVSPRYCRSSRPSVAANDPGWRAILNQDCSADRDPCWMRRSAASERLGGDCAGRTGGRAAQSPNDHRARTGRSG